MRVVGTAGHVDHGKSELVKALTGTHPDRLKEERDRQMTIDLGFAWVTLPNGEPIGIIDVPGHRDFIENMLAGVGGIDAAILVIAADEGVMPQTREHLAILKLLDIPEVIVAVSKIDLVEDRSWLDLVQEEISTLMVESGFDSVPVIPISAVSGEGMEQLIEALMTALAELPVRRDIGRPRLPVDRVFTIAGFGTVVTGTLQDGGFSQGDEIEVLPSGITGRIRGLQTHKQEVKQANPGSRVAMNITGIEVNQITRGDVVACPNSFLPTRLIDVRFSVLDGIEVPVKHNHEVKLYIGSAQRNARVRLIGSDQLKPGDSGWLQLSLVDPVITDRGDRYILRRPSPSSTLGGGFVVDAHPTRKYRRNDPTVLDRFENLASGVPEELLAVAVLDKGPISSRHAILAAGLASAEGEQAMQLLIEDGQILRLSKEEGPSDRMESIVIHRSRWDDVCEKMSDRLSRYHSDFPLRIGMPVEEFRSRLDLPPKYLQIVMNMAEEQGVIVVREKWVASPQFEVKFSSEQESAVEHFIQKAENSGFSPPSVKECRTELGDDLYQYLLDSERIIRVSEDVLFAHDQYDRAVEWVVSELNARKTMSVAEVRNGLGTTRKYALALMEYLDQIGVTVRDEDVRRLA